MPFHVKPLLDPLIFIAAATVITTGACLLLNLKSELPGRVCRAGAWALGAFALLYILFGGKLKLKFLGPHIHIGWLAAFVLFAVLLAVMLKRNSGAESERDSGEAE